MPETYSKYKCGKKDFDGLQMCDDITMLDNSKSSIHSSDHDSRRKILAHVGEGCGWNSTTTLQDQWRHVWLPLLSCHVPKSHLDWLIAFADEFFSL